MFERHKSEQNWEDLLCIYFKNRHTCIVTIHGLGGLIKSEDSCWNSGMKPFPPCLCSVTSKLKSGVYIYNFFCANINTVLVNENNAFFIMPCSEQLTVFIYKTNAYLIDNINLYLVGGCLFEGMCKVVFHLLWTMPTK